MKKSIQESEAVGFKALKFKLVWFKKHLYICGFVIVNNRSNSILRVCILSSYNPAVFEIDITEDIKKVETLIYRYKLDAGNSQEIAKKIMLQFYKAEEKVCEAINEEKLEPIQEILCETLNIQSRDEFKFKYELELLKHERLVKESLNRQKLDTTINKVSTEKFFIKSKPLRDDKRGVSVEKVKPKMELLLELTDTREITKHIMQILFAKSVKEFYAKVVEVKPVNGKYYEIICMLTPAVLTKIVVDKNQKLVIKR